MAVAYITSFTLPPVCIISSQQFKLEVEQGFEQADFYQCAFTCFVPADQCAQYSLYELCPAKNVNDRYTKRYRTVFTIACCISQAGYGLKQEVLARFSFPGAFFSIARYLGIDHPEVDLLNGFIAQPASLHNT